MRLIDADAVTIDMLSAGKIGRATCIKLIKQSKTVDAIRVVYCGNCRRWITKDGVNGRCTVRRFETPYAGYCEEGIK